MNREIKFRAWDKEEKIMCLVDVINLEEGAHLIGNSPTKERFDEETGITWLASNGHFVNFSNLELMQYTNLKDKNGKDIYEGDIVTAKDLVCIVEWKNVGWVATWTRIHQNGDKHSGSPELGFREHEVIGNIYENPELLK